MPLVEIKLVEGVFSSEQKQEMLRKVSEAVVSVEGENMRQVTTVIIEEIKSGEWAIGGKSLQTEDIKALAAGRKEAA